MKKILISLTIATGIAYSISAYAEKNYSVKNEVENSFKKWQESIDSEIPENIVKLYDKNSVLLATLAPEPLISNEAKQEYFKNLVKRENLDVKVNKEFIEVLDNNTASVSGIYTFSFTENGKKIELPARYSFVYEKKDGDWKIITHHSSVVPKI